LKRDAQEAIDRARRHLRRAAREGLEASRALVEAALLAGYADLESDDRRGKGLAREVMNALDAWIATLDGEGPFRMPTSIAEPLRRAIDAEIARWEQRSAEDESARPVLRAFLGLRELLWEFGMRSETRGDPIPPTDRQQEPTSATRPRSARRRVQRFDLDD
jgi:hypothetical protein